MIFSFLKSRKSEPSYAETLVQSLDKMIGSLSGDVPNDSWLVVLREFRDQATSLGTSAPPQSWNRLAKDIMSIYGTMGSFNDNIYPQIIRDIQSLLYISAENAVRATRRELGGTWVSIPDKMILDNGQKVGLVKGEVIALQRDETPIKAPYSPLVYVIFSRLPNDIDNMPRYHIQSESHVRNARHNALHTISGP